MITATLIQAYPHAGDAAVSTVSAFCARPQVGGGGQVF